MNDASNREAWIEANAQYATDRWRMRRFRSAPSVVYLNGTTGLVDFVAMEIRPGADGYDLGGEG